MSLISVLKELGVSVLNNTQAVVKVDCLNCKATFTTIQRVEGFVPKLRKCWQCGSFKCRVAWYTREDFKASTGSYPQTW